MLLNWWLTCKLHTFPSHTLALPPGESGSWSCRSSWELHCWSCWGRTPGRGSSARWACSWCLLKIFCHNILLWANFTWYTSRVVRTRGTSIPKFMALAITWLISLIIFYDTRLSPYMFIVICLRPVDYSAGELLTNNSSDNWVRSLPIKFI